MPSDLPPVEKNNSAYLQHICENENEQEMEAPPLARQLCDPILQRRARDADFEKDRLKIDQDYEKMLATVRKQQGIGVASNQCTDIEDPLRMTIIGTDDEDIRKAFYEALPNDELHLPFVMINPEIISWSEETYFPQRGEGCLSLNCGFRGKVARHQSITVKFFDMDGVEHIEVFHAIPAHIIQHELDHINEGVLFFEKILAECSEAQKQEMIECIALFEAGQVEENEDESLKRALCFDRDETGKVIFYPEVFKMGLLDISHETLAGLKKSLIR